ncbi:EamA family transporter [Piscinibacterium candidicorallinum]|uniref:EamA family transporter n=1 Tax=Piscinibacterium candidicorallinum TaxID=1793872 RepID=A0ABV7HAU8_9BURK
MPILHLIALTLLALLAFAGNSLLCRAALAHTQIDAASFTTVRMVSGALALWLLVQLRARGTARARMGQGSWGSAAALFAYAAAFSFAYVQLGAALGALILFGAVQTSMTSWGLLRGERLGALQVLGLVLAFGGLVGLLLPGLSAPPLAPALLMMAAGCAWGVYSLRGKGAGDPLQVTAGNFLRTVPMALALSLALLAQARLDTTGVLYAVLSGALTSGVGYAIWYAALPHLKAMIAATLQLSVPVIAAVGAVLFLGEALSLRLLLASAAILGGIALVVTMGQRKA